MAATIKVGQNASDPVVSDGTAVYLTNDSAPWSVSVIDVATFDVTTIPVGLNPEPIALDSTGIIALL